MRSKRWGLCEKMGLEGLTVEGKGSCPWFYQNIANYTAAVFYKIQEFIICGIYS